VPADIDVVQYLASKGIRVRQANGPEVTAPCFFDCNEDPQSNKRKLYINVAEGFYDCKVCGSTGGTYLLQKHFGDDPKKSTTLVTDKDAPSFVDGFTRRQILDAAALTGQKMLENNDDVLLYLLKDRGLTEDTIIDRKLGVISNNWSLTGSLPKEYTKEQLKGTGLVWRDGQRAGQDFLYNHLLIPYVVRGHVSQIRGRNLDPHAKAKYVTGPGDPTLLYNSDDLDGATDVIITEGEFDTMVVKQALMASPEDKHHRIGVVAIAGTSALPDNFEAYFRNAKRVYLGFDSDGPGKKAAAKIKELLGAKARILELPFENEVKCDWSEFLLPVPYDADDYWKSQHPYAGHDYRDVVALMGTASGKRLFSMTDTGVTYRQQKNTGPGLKTGYMQLDATIQPGMLPGQVMIILAKTGTGKTVFLCNLAYYMRKHKVMFISLEMTREEVYERMQRIFRFHMPQATDQELEQALGNLMICDENRLVEGDLNKLVDEFEMETGDRPEVVFVDYLGYYARGAQGNSQYEKVTNAVMALKAEAKQGRFAIVSPAQVNRVAKEGKPIDLDDARDSGAIEETADFLLAIYRPDSALTTENQGQQRSGKIQMGVLKSRHGGKDRVFTFMMDDLTLAVVDDHTPEAKRVAEHNYLAWRGTTYDQLRKQETAPEQLSLQRRK
jgi:archaellum biogenesis ATPase FlaH